MVVLLRAHQRAERPLDDLAQRRMDVDGIEHGPGALVRGVHQIDDLLNQDGGMGTDDVRPQDLQRVPCHDDLHKEVPYVHRLSLAVSSYRSKPIRTFASPNCSMASFSLSPTPAISG